MSPHLPKHTVQRRDLLNYNGTVHNSAVFVRSGTLENVAGSTTSSIALNFDAKALRLRRVEVFHSGSNLNDFHFSIDTVASNSGSAYDPRAVVSCYNNLPGSKDFSQGMDQVEDLYLITDTTPETEGNLYLKFMPFSSGVNDFKYLLFFEAVFLYIDKDGSING